MKEDKVAMNKEKFLKSDTSVLYVFRNKDTGDYIDEDGNMTESVLEAVGLPVYEDAVKSLIEFDEPYNWYIVTKITNVTILGEPIEVKQFI